FLLGLQRLLERRGAVLLQARIPQQSVLAELPLLGHERPAFRPLSRGRSRDLSEQFFVIWKTKTVPRGVQEFAINRPGDERPAARRASEVAGIPGHAGEFGCIAHKVNMSGWSA